MTETMPPPRFELLRVLGATGETLFRQHKPLLLVTLVCGAIPAIIGSQIDFIVAWVSDPISQALHPILWPLHDLAESHWLAWLRWGLLILLWAIIDIVAMIPLVWITLSDHRGRQIDLPGARAVLRRAFVPVLLIELLFSIRTWAHPLSYLLPVSNASFIGHFILRIVFILLAAWFGVATSVVIEEGQGFRRALTRSGFLTRGRRLLMGGFFCATHLVLAFGSKQIHELVFLIHLRSPFSDTIVSLLLYNVLATLVIVFETVLYLEMRRLRDPFPTPQVAAQ